MEFLYQTHRQEPRWRTIGAVTIELHSLARNALGHAIVAPAFKSAGRRPLEEHAVMRGAEGDVAEGHRHFHEVSLDALHLFGLEDHLSRFAGQEELATLQAHVSEKCCFHGAECDAFL